MYKLLSDLLLKGINIFTKDIIAIVNKDLSDKLTMIIFLLLIS